MGESLLSTCFHLDSHDCSFLKQIIASSEDPTEDVQRLACPRQNAMRTAQEGHSVNLRTKPLPVVLNHLEPYLPTAPVLQPVPGAQ